VINPLTIGGRAMRNIYEGIKMVEVILAVIVIIAVSGCNKIAGNADAASESEPIVAVICIDGSISYKYLDQAKRTVDNILTALPSGSKVYIRWIANDSVKDNFSIVSVVLPDEVKGDNPFDPKLKRQQANAKAKVLNLKKQAMKMVMDAGSPKSTRTDVYGALYAASERFKLNSDRTPLLILLTDMDDDAGKDNAYNIVLNNTTVKIMGFQTGDSDTSLKNHWTEYLSKHGVLVVEFIPLDEPFNLGGK
jgi:hypothetical protein